MDLASFRTQKFFVESVIRPSWSKHRGSSFASWFAMKCVTGQITGGSVPGTLGFSHHGGESWDLYIWLEQVPNCYWCLPGLSVQKIFLPVTKKHMDSQGTLHYCRWSPESRISSSGTSSMKCRMWCFQSLSTAWSSTTGLQAATEGVACGLQGQLHVCPDHSCTKHVG